MSVFVIRIIAYVSMLIDHLTLCFVDSNSQAVLYLAGRGIGRLAFPLFCWLLVEGYFHTGDLKKYMLRLLIITLASEPCFDLLMLTSGSSETPLEHQNVCLTLLLGLLAITAIDKWKDVPGINPFIFTTASTMVIVLACTLAMAAKSDYGAVGILLILMLYYLRKRPVALCIGTFVWAVICALFGYGMEEFAIIAVVLANVCNGEQGPKMPKRLNYFFYPAHMLILGLVLWGMKGFTLPL